MNIADLFATILIVFLLAGLASMVVAVWQSRSKK